MTITKNNNNKGMRDEMILKQLQKFTIYEVHIKHLHHIIKTDYFVNTTMKTLK